MSTAMHLNRMSTMTHLNRPGVVAFFAFLFFFFGCGNPDDKLPEPAAKALAPQVEAIRTAAAAGDRAGAQAGVDQLRAQLSQLRSNGAVAEDDAARVLDAVQAVEAQLALLPAPTTTTTATTAPPPVVEEDGDHDDGGKRKRHKDEDD
jgi:hypothetical protein